MRPTMILLLLILSQAAASDAQAAFVTCQDARNYGENSARLFVGQSFSRIACDPALLERVHLALDRVLSRQVLRTNDSDAEKLCFYEGMLDGLLGQLVSEYAACSCDPQFECLSGATVSSHMGSMISALSLSLSEPASLGSEQLRAAFAAVYLMAEVPTCEELDSQVCTDALLQSLSPQARESYACAAGPLGELVCAVEQEGLQGAQERH